MLQIPTEEIVQKIKSASGLSEAEIKEQIKKKLKSLDGLVSEEGAAYIVANELGVKLFHDPSSGPLKLKELVAGMRSVEVVGKITRIFEVRSFHREGKTSEVGSLVIEDETGRCRVVIWDERVNWMKEGKLAEGKVIRVRNGYVKANNIGGKEVHLSNRSQLIIDKETEIKTSGAEAASAKIKDIQPDQNVKILGTVVKIFSPNFYQVCPQCKKKVTEADEGTICTVHGVVEPTFAMVFSLVIDDGTENMRCTAFQNRAESMVGMGAAEAKELGEDAVLEKVEAKLLGKNLEIEGNIRENKAFDRIELMINNVNLNPNARVIAQRLMKGG